MGNDTEDLVIGTAAEEDLPHLMELYRFLHPEDPILPIDDRLKSHWQSILDNDALHYVVARSEGRLVCACALTLIPNLTRNARPYGLIENVITHPDYRKPVRPGANQAWIVETGISNREIEASGL